MNHRKDIQHHREQILEARALRDALHHMRLEREYTRLENRHQGISNSLYPSHKKGMSL